MSTQELRELDALYTILCGSCAHSKKHRMANTSIVGTIINDRMYALTRSSPSKMRKCSDCGIKIQHFYKLKTTK